jgi:hypothetical protein
MLTGINIPEPFQFNPIKHHLAFIREFISCEIKNEDHDKKRNIVRQMKHIGTSVMDIYTGTLSVNEILEEVKSYLSAENLISPEVFATWTGKHFSDFKIIALSDGSQWMLKYHDQENRHVHLFPARSSQHTLRIKANTLKSAILYIILAGKDFITDEDLNMSRAMAGLSPVKEVAESEAIYEMIELLRY